MKEGRTACHAVVVATEMTYEAATRVNEICHANGIAFVSSDIRGVFGQIFCDFGDQFTVFDTDGEVRRFLYKTCSSLDTHARRLIHARPLGTNLMPACRGGDMHGRTCSVSVGQIIRQF